MARGLDQKTVKSAQRVLEILQYVSDARYDATVMAVARDLAYPQSSTSELLSCLVHLGYLRHDRKRRTFRPTARVGALGHGVRRDIFQRGALLDMVEELAAESARPVIVAMRHGTGLQYVHIAGDAHPLSRIAPPALLHSSLGRVLLADCDDTLIRRIVHRLNAEADSDHLVRPGAFLEGIDHIRRHGFDVSEGDAAFSGRIAAMALPAGCEEPLAIGAVMPESAGDAAIREWIAHIRGRIGGRTGWGVHAMGAAPRRHAAG